MTTDIRAALRAAAAIFDMLANRSEASDYHPLVIPTEYHDAARNFRVLADAPPTVAELLPRVDATHEVHWTDVDGDEWRAFAVGGGRPIGFAFRRKNRGDWYDGNPCDLTAPATLVEVTP